MSLEMPRDSEVSLTDVLRGVWRRKWMVLALWLIGTGIGLATVRFIPASYQTEAQVLVGNPDQPLPGSSGQLPQLEQIDQRRVLSELAIINSNDMAARIVDQLKLTDNPDYNSKRRPGSVLRSLAVALGFKEDVSKLTDKQVALEKLVEATSIYQLPESNAIGIKVKAGNPELAAKVADAFANTYVESTRLYQGSTNDQTREWLGRQIDSLRTKVATAAAAAEKFRAESGLIEGQVATLNEQEISELNSQVTLAETARVEAKARLAEIEDLLRTTGSIDTSAEVLASSAVATLRDRQLAATQKISELGATYLDNHPKMISARKELRDVQLQIRREVLKVAQSLEGQANVAASRVRSLREQLEQLKTKQVGSNQDRVKLKELEREIEVDRTLLESLLQRYANANATRELTSRPAFARVIQRAAVPASIHFPKPGPMTLISSLAGLTLGLSLAFLAEMMRAASRLTHRPAYVPEMLPPTAKSSAARPQAPVSPRIPEAAAPPPIKRAPIPKTELPQNRSAPIQRQAKPTDGIESIIPIKPQSTTAETANQLSKSLITLRDENRLFSTRFAGQTKFKTDVALFVVATARAVAESGRKILVIDADPTSHALEPLFDLEPGAGLSDLIAGTADFTKIIRREQQSSVHVISYGLSPSDQATETIAARLPSILSNLEDVYDIVFVHAGDIAPDTPQSLLGCKSVVMIVPQNDQKDLPAAEQKLHEIGAESVMHVTLMQETILT
jgi:polysaccharide biosynthesis transport protein